MLLHVSLYFQSKLWKKILGSWTLQRPPTPPDRHWSFHGYMYGTTTKRHDLGNKQKQRTWQSISDRDALTSPYQQVGFQPGCTCTHADEWKVTRVPPIPNSSNKSDPGNYHPISLLSVLSKIIEKHVRNLLVHHLEDFHPLSTQQWASPMVNPPLELYLLLLIAGTDYLTQGLTSALYFLTFIEKLLTQSPTDPYYRSSII